MTDDVQNEDSPPSTANHAPSIQTVAAWAGSDALGNPGAAVDLAKNIGLDRLDLMVNDFSASRACTAFSVPQARRIGELAQCCGAAGITLGFTSWVMPCEDFIRGAAAELLPLMRDLGVSRLMWDAEEPWTKNEGGMPHEDAAKLVAELFGDVRMGVTAIVYVNPVVKPLADVVKDVRDLVPQAYATSNNGLDPRKLVGTALSLWEQRLGRRPATVGLAAYRQGDDPDTLMHKAIDGVTEHGIQTVAYWSLRQISSSPEVQAFIQNIPRATS